MLSNILWGLFLITLVAFMIYRDKGKKKRNPYPRHREKTEHEKEVEIAIEKEKSRRNGPPGIGGGGL
ncbi:hypothetical protein ACFO3D_13540 [Virgibacillus kekensis]|uniref:Uncharacterized protein n=1 Tax=Virgibacillus kekensis TaxID=202261 RepID=A0ABV9DK65_9BACI